MTPAKLLYALFRAIEEEVRDNSAFAARLTAILQPTTGQPGTEDSTVKRRRGRRNRAPFDPYVLLTQSDDALRAALTEISIEELKDIISEFGLDSSKLALKWRSRDRLVDLIVSTTRSRSEKGDAFRS